MYDRDSLPLSPSPAPPADYASRPTTLHDNAEFNRYGVAPEHPTLETQVSDDYAREVRHAYFAAVSYVDAQIGRVIQELEQSGLNKNTIVIVWGDHGWHLGDQGVWGKHTLHERSLLSPLLVKLPDMLSAGVPTDAIVETLDIYPMIAELVGIDVADELSGTSLVPQLRNPSEASGRYARGYFGQDVTIRSQHYRAIAYGDGLVDHVEVFDHRSDPGETKNMAQDLPAEVQGIVSDVLGHLLDPPSKQ